MEELMENILVRGQFGRRIPEKKAEGNPTRIILVKITGGVNVRISWRKSSLEKPSEGFQDEVLGELLELSLEEFLDGSCGVSECLA